MFDVRPSSGSVEGRSVIADVGERRAEGWELVDGEHISSVTVLHRLGGSVRSLKRGLREELIPSDTDERTDDASMPVGFCPTFQQGKLRGSLAEPILLDGSLFGPAERYEVLGLGRDDAAAITLRAALGGASSCEVEVAYRLRGDCVRAEIVYRSAAREIVRILPALRWVLEPRVAEQLTVECEADAPRKHWTSYTEAARMAGPTIEIAGERAVHLERAVQSLRWNGGGLRIRSSPEYRHWRITTSVQKRLALLEARACASSDGDFVVPLLLQPGEVRSMWCELRFLR